MAQALTTPEPLVVAVLGPDLELLYATKDERHALDRELRFQEIAKEAQEIYDDRKVAVVIVPPSFWPATN